MAKEAYIGINNLAKKIKKMYISIGDNTPKVEFLSSSGNQWINTGIVTRAGIKILAKIEVINFNIDNVLFGNNHNPLPCSLYISHTSHKFCSVINSIVKTSNKIAELNTIYNIVFYIGSDRQYISINNEIIREESYAISSNASQIQLFKRNSSTINGSYIKIYGCKIYNNDELVKNFIPVKNKNLTPCMYDLVSSSYYYNQGSGDGFGCGNEGDYLIGVAKKIKKAYVGVNRNCKIILW